MITPDGSQLDGGPDDSDSDSDDSPDDSDSSDFPDDIDDGLNVTVLYYHTRWKPMGRLWL